MIENSPLKIYMVLDVLVIQEHKDYNAIRIWCPSNFGPLLLLVHPPATLPPPRLKVLHPRPHLPQPHDIHLKPIRPEPPEHLAHRWYQPGNQPYDNPPHLRHLLAHHAPKCLRLLLRQLLGGQRDGLSVPLLRVRNRPRAEQSNVPVADKLQPLVSRDGGPPGVENGAEEAVRAEIVKERDGRRMAQ